MIAVLLDMCMCVAKAKEEVYSRHLLRILRNAVYVTGHSSGARCKGSRKRAVEPVVGDVARWYLLEQPPHAVREWCSVFDGVRIVLFIIRRYRFETRETRLVWVGSGRQLVRP